MQLSTILHYRWWHPCYLLPGHSSGDSWIDTIWRNNDGDVVHVRGGKITNDKISPPEVKYIKPKLDWNLDFVQKGTMFHTENMDIWSANSLMFQPSPAWKWNPKLDLCQQIVVSLRIGGYLVDVWKMEDTALDLDNRDVYVLRGACEKPDLQLNRSVFDVQYGEAVDNRGDIRHRVTFLLQRNSCSVIKFEMISPAPTRAPDRYAHHNPHQCRNLLLDLVRYKGMISKKVLT